MPAELSPHAKLTVAFVAPSLAILGGQAVQARRLLDAWATDAEIAAFLVPINPEAASMASSAHSNQVRADGRQRAHLFTDADAGTETRRHRARFFCVVLVVPARAAAGGNYCPPPRPARPHELSQRRGAGSSPPLGDRQKHAAIGRSRTSCPPVSCRASSPSTRSPREIVPNIIDRDRFRFRLRDPLRPRLLSTRNFEALYDVASTVRAFAVIQSRHPEATLTLVGGGSERPRSGDLVAELGLRGVTFAGRVDPADVWQYHADADIYVQTPAIDNMPASILEAFASGLPVVSTECRRRTGDAHRRRPRSAGAGRRLPAGGGADRPASRRLDVCEAAGPRRLRHNR